MSCCSSCACERRRIAFHMAIDGGETCDPVHVTSDLPLGRLSGQRFRTVGDSGRQGPPRISKSHSAPIQKASIHTFVMKRPCPALGDSRDARSRAPHRRHREGSTSRGM
jgi:hypothetical protein